MGRKTRQSVLVTKQFLMLHGAHLETHDNGFWPIQALEVGVGVGVGIGVGFLFPQCR